MTRRYEMSNGWKWFWAIICLIILAGGIFCAVTGIVSAIHNISFVEQLQQWFGIVEDTATEANAFIGTTNIFLKMI